MVKTIPEHIASQACLNLLLFDVEIRIAEVLCISIELFFFLVPISHCMWPLSLTANVTSYTHYKPNVVQRVGWWIL